MSGTMSTPIDWGQIYQQNPTNQPLSDPNDHNAPSISLLGERVSEATTTTATTTGSATATNPSSGHLNPVGRVSKPARRRSRVSRKTPITLLNTDATNFRAMVQQFTGGPSLNAPFASQLLDAPPHGLVSFGLEPPRQSMVPLGYHHILQSQQQQQQRQQPYMLSLGNNNSVNDRFTTTTRSMDVSNHGLFNIDGHSLHGPSSSSTSTIRPPSSNSSDHRN